MRLLALSLCLFWCLAPVPAQPDLRQLLKAVEDRYNSPRTLSAAFEQAYSWQGRNRRVESGDLFLMKPGRMRWEYRSPGEKLFLADGKEIYFYTPHTNRVERMKVKESGDLRAPLAFLMGRLDFWRDFREFRTRPEGADTRIVALPKSDKSPYREVEFVVTPQHRIRRLVITGQDQSVMEFTLSNERINPPLAEKLFRFEMPPGAELIESAGEEQD